MDKNMEGRSTALLLHFLDDANVINMLKQYFAESAIKHINGSPASIKYTLKLGDLIEWYEVERLQDKKHINMRDKYAPKSKAKSKAK
tara:strand:- start:202 stop:462 length:261 start_codon:yes stop_codon:yes gene_type:complete